MADGLTISIRANTWGSKSKNFLQRITSAAEAAMPIVLETILADAASRAPSKEYEEELIMYGQSGIPGANKTIPDSSEKDRERFVRNGDDQLYLQEAIRDPRTYSVIGTTIAVGNVTALNNITKFSWTDAGQKVGTISHTTEYGVFSSFEFGANLLIEPKFGKYALTPTPFSRVQTFDKSIPAFGMFTSIDRFTVTEAIKEQLRRVEL